MSERLRGRRTFVRLRTEGRHLRSGLVSCTVVVDSSVQSAHVGFVVGKASGSAVRRNRIRRRLRALVKPHLGSLPAGLYLFGASPRVAECAFEEAQRSVEGLVMKLSQVPERRGSADVS